jgi:hypothetical protein
MSRTHARRSWIAATAVVGLALTAVVGCTPRPTTPGTGSGGVSPLCTTTSTAGAPTTGYWAAGPYATTVTKVGTNTYFHPTTMGQSGEKHPVILWGNGTSVTPDCYVVLLTHWASYGFIAAAANTTNSGSGQEMLAGLDYLTTANRTPGNKFNGVVDLANVGTSGHSQGGGGSIAAARDPRVKTMMPIEGAGGGATTRASGITALVLAGDADTLVGTTGPTSFFNGLRIPGALAIARGASHFTVNNAAFRPATTAWALWQLKGDQTAKAQFVGPNCGLCSPSGGFSTYRANAQLQAL